MKSTVRVYVILVQAFTLIRSSNACGGNVDGSRGFIISPNYPNSYTHNSNCTWTITGTAGSNFSLKFEMFNIACNDTVTIYDGNSVSASKLLDQKCGISQVIAIGTLKSSSNVITVQFLSDGTIRSAGFNLTWEIILEKTTSEATPENNTDDIFTVTFPHQTTTLSADESDGSPNPTDPQTSNSVSPTYTPSTKSTSVSDEISTLIGSFSASGVTHTSKVVSTEQTTSSTGVSQTTMAAAISLPILAGAAGGGSAFLIIIIIILVCCLRRSRPTEQKKSKDSLSADSTEQMRGDNLMLRDVDEGAKKILNTHSYTDITDEAVSNMLNMKAIADKDKQVDVNGECKIIGFESNDQSASEIELKGSDMKVETETYERVPSLDIYAVPNKNHNKGESITENSNTEMKAQITDIYAVPHKDRDDIYQEKPEDEYDVLHQKRQKITSGDDIYDVSRPDESDYSEARHVRNLNDDDTYDHTDIKDEHSATYDTADHVLSE